MARTGRLSPASTLGSAPSTSILTKAGAPNRSIIKSSVVVSISIWRFHSTWEKSGSLARASCHAVAIVVTVGVRSLIRRDARPASSPTAASITSTFGDRGEQRAEQPRKVGLRLDRHDAASHGGKGTCTVTGMRAEIEDQVAARDKL